MSEALDVRTVALVGAGLVFVIATTFAVSYLAICVVAGGEQ